MSQVLDSQLTGTVRNLGAVLGDTIRDQLGEQWLQRIEAVRKDGRKAHQGDEDCAKRVKLLFSELKNDELLTVGRAFSQFLNLANIAEQEFNSNNDQDDPIDTLFNHLDEAGIKADTFEKALEHLNIELVLTAHPTEVTRRTLIHKHSELAKCLSKAHASDINESDRDKIKLVLLKSSVKHGTPKKFVLYALPRLTKPVGDFLSLKTHCGKPSLSLFVN